MKARSFFFALLFSGSVFAQGVPQGIKYQAVVRDLNGDIVSQKPIRITLSIIQYQASLCPGNPEGCDAVYSETHTIQSNIFGLVNFEIGRGTPSSPLHFEDIDWGAAPHYMQLELEIQGTGFTNMSTVELLSVPYALYAESSNKAENVDFSNLKDRYATIYHEAEDRLVSSKIYQSLGGSNDTLVVETGNTKIGGDALIEGKTTTQKTIVQDTAFTKDILIQNGSSLHINDYRFPKDAGSEGQVLVLDDDNSLIWSNFKSTISIRAGSDQASIILDTNGKKADSIPFDWVRGGDLLRNRNQGAVVIGSDFPSAPTNAKLHVENGDLVVYSKAEATSALPYDFGANTGGILWWGGDKHAFRSGSNSINNNWNDANIGKYSIGLGRNIQAGGERSIGIGDSILALDINTFGIGKNITVTGENSFSIGNNETASNYGVLESRNSFSIGNNNTIINAPTGERNIIVGNENVIDKYTDAMLLGIGNRLGDMADATEDVINILIGRNNEINTNTAQTNILLGTNNKADDLSIVIGRKNSAVTNSIVIGENNSATDENNTSEEKNIIIGHGNKPLGARESIIIGSSIPSLPPSAFPFLRDGHSINIGQQITPFVQGNHTPINSINIGQDIQTNSRNSISIGNGLTSYSNHSINIGTKNENTAADYSMLIGSNIFNDIYQNVVILGGNSPAAYPGAFGENYDEDGIDQSAIPRFVVGHYFPDRSNNNNADNYWQTYDAAKIKWANAGYSGDAPPYNLLYINDNANAYFGVSGGTEMTPQFFDSDNMKYGRVYARAFFCPDPTSIQTLSDKRLKNTIQPITNDFHDALYSLRSFSYYYNKPAAASGNFSNSSTSQKIHWGFLAQDVQQYFPHLVNKEDDGTLTMSYLGFVPILWKITQDQQVKIEAQEIQIADQQYRMEDLELRIAELEQKLEHILQNLDD